jgi:hypothetical protein
MGLEQPFYYMGQWDQMAESVRSDLYGITFALYGAPELRSRLVVLQG